VEPAVEQAARRQVVVAARVRPRQVAGAAQAPRQELVAAVPLAVPAAVPQGAASPVALIAIAPCLEALGAGTGPVHRMSEHRGRSQTTAAIAYRNDREVASTSGNGMGEGTVAMLATAMA